MISNDAELVKFVLDNDIADYSMLLEYTKCELEQSVAIMIGDFISKIPNEIKQEFDKKSQRKEIVAMGFEATTLKDLKNDFKCAINENNIEISKYIGKGEETIIFPGSIDDVSDYLFKGQISNKTISKIIFEEAVRNIKIEEISSIFLKLSSLTELHLPSSLEFIDKRIFTELPHTTTIYSKNEKYVVVDDVLVYEDTAIFVNNQLNNKDIIIPYGVKKISTKLFYGSKYIDSITLPKSIELIEYQSFMFSSVFDLKFPEKLDGELIIEKEAFSKCSRIWGAYFPEGLIEIEDYCFYTCSNLKRIVFSNTVKKIGNNVFEECKVLRDIVIPGSVERIGDRAFDHCCAMTALTIEDGVKEIGNLSFSECRLVKEILLPKSIEKVGVSPFSCCAGLNTFNVHVDNPHFCSIDNFLYNKDCTILYAAHGRFKVKEVTFLDSVVELKSRAFDGFTKLTKVNIHKDINKIEEDCFMSCYNIKSYEVSEENKYFHTTISGRILCTKEKM